MKQYLDLLKDVLHNGEIQSDRTKTGIRSVFGRQLRFNLDDGFPLLTTKHCHLHSIVHELLWFLSGDTNIDYLNKHKVKIWDEWAHHDGSLGPIYGKQWRSWGHGDTTTIDQISNVISSIKNDPYSRRHIVSSWNVGELEKMALPPCHILFQFHVHNNKLSCQLYQRSADIFLGVPFNIASYALLTMMVAQVCGYHAGEFIHSLGNVHLYQNHINQAELQISREPRPLPHMKLNPEIKNILDFREEDFQLEGYNPYPAIKAPVAI